MADAVLGVAAHSASRAGTVRHACHYPERHEDLDAQAGNNQGSSRCLACGNFARLSDGSTKIDDFIERAEWQKQENEYNSDRRCQSDAQSHHEVLPWRSRRPLPRQRLRRCDADENDRAIKT